MNRRAGTREIAAESAVAHAAARNALLLRAGATVQQAEVADGVFRLVCVEDRAELVRHAAAWDDLALHTMEPNVFCETWLLQPALEAYAGDARLCLVLVYLDRPRAAPLLCGFFPFERVSRLKGMPLPHLRLWRSKYSFLATPLLRRARAEDCLGALLDWLGDDPAGGDVVDWGLIRGDGPFFQVLLDVLNARRISTHFTDFYSRALLTRGASLEDYLSRVMSPKARKDLRRRTRRLQELGELEFVALESPAQAVTWREEFMGLEAAGWKGRGGSALASTAPGRRFFSAVVSESARRGQLEMIGLRFSGRMIAMQCILHSGEGAFAFKIAYDESFARYSPGLLLEMHHLARFHEGRGPEWMDSCATPAHFMANRLWLGRRSIVSLISSSGGRSGEFLVSLLPLLRWGYRLARTTKP